jgi:hypothetical protein
LPSHNLYFKIKVFSDIYMASASGCFRNRQKKQKREVGFCKNSLGNSSGSISEAHGSISEAVELESARTNIPHLITNRCINTGQTGFNYNELD